jgi:hypothetical protein
MLKLVTLIKRKPGLSMQEFIEHYESGHRLLGERYLKPHACRYVRRFLHPVGIVEREAQADPAYDVLMEIWFADQAAYDAAMQDLAEPAVAQEIAEDEERLFDRDSICSFLVEEYESVLT